MDIVGKETLENMLSEFTGTVIFVSHDRYFVNKIARSLLVFDGKKTEFIRSTYEEFEENRKSDNLNNPTPSKTSEKNSELLKKDIKRDKKTFSTPLKDRSKKEKRLIKLNELINDCEKKLALFNEQMNLPEVYSDYVKINEIQQNISSVQNNLDGYYSEWLEISTELENSSES